MPSHANHVTVSHLNEAEKRIFVTSLTKYIRITRLDFTNHEATARLLHSGHWDTLVEERSFSEKKREKTRKFACPP